MIKAETPIVAQVKYEDEGRLTFEEEIPAGSFLLLNAPRQSQSQSTDPMDNHHDRLLLGMSAEYGNPNHNRTFDGFRANEILTEVSPRTKEIMANCVRSQTRQSFSNETGINAYREWTEVRRADSEGAYWEPVRFEGTSVVGEIEYIVILDHTPVETGEISFIGGPSHIEVNDRNLNASYINNDYISFDIVRDQRGFMLMGYNRVQVGNMRILVRCTYVSSDAKPNLPPVWITEELDHDVQLEAVDPEGYAVSYRIVGDRPDGFDISPDGIVDMAGMQSGTYSVILAASDGVKEAAKTFTLEVGDQPSWVSTSFTGLEGTSVTWTLNAVNRTHFTVNGTLPSWMSMTSSGVITANLPAVTTDATYTASFRAHNGFRYADRLITFVVSDTPLLTPMQGILIQNQTEFELATSSEFAPPTQQQIFNTWTRFGDTGHYPAGITPQGEAATWAYNATLNRVESTINSVQPIGFVSPDSFENYRHLATLRSTNNDDDLVSVILAYAVVNGQPEALVAARGGRITDQGALNEPWSIRIWRPMNAVAARRNEQVIVGSALAPSPAVAGGWNTAGETRVEAIRNGNTFTVRCSQFGATTIDPTTELTYTLPNGSPFAGATPYGYGAYSQANATFTDLVFEGRMDVSTIYDLRQNPIRVWTYSHATQSWSVDPNRSIYTDFTPPRLVENPNTEKVFKIDGPPNIYSVSRVS